MSKPILYAFFSFAAKTSGKYPTAWFYFRFKITPFSLPPFFFFRVVEYLNTPRFIARVKVSGRNQIEKKSQISVFLRRTKKVISIIAKKVINIIVKEILTPPPLMKTH